MSGFFSTISHYQHRFATAAFVLGFLVDIVTFRNISLGTSQIILSVHLVVVGLAILILAAKREEGRDSILSPIQAVAPVMHQYSTGALLSAFLVLYTASGSLSASAPFLALVAIAAIGNETIRLKKNLLPFRTTLYALNLLLFAALAIPVALSSVSVWTFIVSCIAALVVFALFVSLGSLILRQPFAESKDRIIAGGAAVFILMSLLYFTNLIPPIPLSLKSAGFYHSVSKEGNQFFALDEKRGFLERFFSLSGETIHLTPGASAYAFTAVFAPAHLDTTVRHRWERFDEEISAWETVYTTSPFSITGGREGGYRLYSFLANVVPGRYRVSVETVRGAVIGRTTLIVKHVSLSPVLETVMLE